MLKRRDTKKSVTFIELIMAIVLLAIIAGIGVPLLLAANEAWVLAIQRNEMSEVARVALDRIIREIRMTNNTTSVLTANGTTFSFIAQDIDGDSSTDTITFGRSGTTLRRNLGGTVNDLAEDVSALAFTYYDSSGSVIATPAVSPSATDIRRVKVSLTFSLGATQLNIESQVSPRMLNL